MQTFEEQGAFFNKHWDGMRQAVETGGASAVIRFIEGFEDETERRVLYVFARRGLVMKDWRGKSFDPYIEVCRAGMKEMLRQAEKATDEETRKKRVDNANVMSYNLSADLAECWVGDEAPRERRHFEVGLQAAEDCVRWREELNKGPAPRSMAFWAKGMHQFSLGDFKGAEESWQKSFGYAVESAREQKLSPDVSGEGEFSVILGAGYVGLAKLKRRDETGEAQYRKAIEAFRAQLTDEKKKDDAQFGIEQLEKVRSL